MRSVTAVCLCVVMLSGGAVRAEEGGVDVDLEAAAPVDVIGIHLYAENDGQLFKPNNTTDRYYTSGVRIAVTHSPDWAEHLADALSWLPLGGADDGGALRVGMGYAAGQKIFTPGNIRRDPPKPDDRPYAGWLYGAVYFDRATDTQFDRVEIQMGVVGPSALGEQAQNGIHEIFGGDEAKGWGTQLHDEFGFNLLYTRKWKIALGSDRPRPHDGFAAELIPSAGFILGNVNRELNADATFRIGWNLPDDFGPSRVDFTDSATARYSPDDWGVYGFVRVAGHAVEHDLFIEGNSYHNGTGGTDEENFYGELQLGVFLYCHCFQLGYAQTFVTKQFEHQTGSHAYGLWTISCRFEF